MIDIHAHILPGIDDGAEDMYDTLEMARMAADSGVDKIIATPHCNIPGMYGNYFGKEYIDRYESVVRAVREEKIPIEILPGMEVFSTEDLPELIVNHSFGQHGGKENAGTEESKTFSGFLTGQCVEALILGAMFVITMTLFRLPYALLTGIVIAFTALVPVFGAFIGCAVGAFLIFMVSPFKALMFIVQTKAQE